MICTHFCGIPMFSDTVSLPGKGGMNGTAVYMWKITDFCNTADLSCYWGSQHVRSKSFMKKPFGAFRQFNV